MLELDRAKKAIQKLAKAKGIDEKTMRLEMEKAIEAGSSNPDSSVGKVWEASPFKGNKPSLEEFILWCASRL